MSKPSYDVHTCVHTSGGFNDPDMLVVGLEGMFPYGEKPRPFLSECQPQQ